MPKETDIILNRCMGLKEKDSVLIITDSKLRKIADGFLESASKITDKAELEEIPIAEVSGQEPPEDIARDMLNYSVIILVTTKSLSHTNARKNASKNGARIASLPTVTEDILKRCIDIDYNKLEKNAKKITKMLTNGKKVKITAKKGTNIEFSIAGRKAVGDDYGIYNKKGDFGNLPAGESFIAPVEGTANGCFVADASFASIGKLEKSIKIAVEKGFATKIEGDNGKISALLDKNGNDARNIAEFGIGLNEKAKISGSVLEDEKVLGTCHIALGNNSGFGGKVNVPLHLDGVIQRPTIEIDGKKIMEEGKFLT